MNTTFRSSPAATFLFRALLPLFVLPAPALLATSDDSGTIVGHVFADSSGKALRGAVVTLDQTQVRDISGDEGSFRFQSVQPGTHQVTTEYLGSTPLVQDVEVKAHQTTALSLHVKDSAVTMEKYTVESFRTGQARSLNQQKTSDTVVTIVSSDAIGRFPDINTAEAVRRLPGVTMERDTGEGRFVNVRGVTSEYNNVSMDGQQVLSVESSSRRVNLNVLPSNVAAQVEVVKSKTPDMVADGIGATVNLVTKSAFDSDRRILEGSAAIGNVPWKKKITEDFSLTYGDRFGENRQLGFLVGVGFSRLPRGYDDIEQGYDSQKISGTEGLVSAGFELRNYLNVLTHRSLTLNLEARPDSSSSYFIRSSYNRYDDDRKRRRLTFNWRGDDSGDYTAGANPGDVTVANTSIETDLQSEMTKQTLTNVTAGGKNNFGGQELSYSVAYSFGGEKVPFNKTIRFIRSEGVDAYYNRTNYNFPAFGAINGANPYDAKQSTLDAAANAPQDTRDRMYAETIDYKISFDSAGHPAYAKFGVRGSNRTKKLSLDYRALKVSAAPATTLSDLAELDDGEFLYRPRYHLGATPTVDLTNRFFNANQSLFSPNLQRDHRAYYRAKEDIYAAYGLSSIDLDALHLSGGLRVEDTHTQYEAYLFPTDASGTVLPEALTTVKKKYTDLFPSIHARYDVSKQLVLRASASTSIVRPQFSNVVPSQTIDSSGRVGTISGGNPDLKPTKSYDLDVGAEYYFSGIGVVSVSGFYKDIKDYVFPRQTTVQSGPYKGYLFNTSANIPTSKVYGVELAYNQQFSSLPGALSGLGIYANATLTHSRAEIRSGEFDRLPKQTPAVENLALYYEKYGVTARLALTHTGAFLYQVGDDRITPGASDVFYDKSTLLDFTISYAVNKNLSVFFNALNLTNQPLRFYESNTTRPIQQEYYDVQYETGVKFNF